VRGGREYSRDGYVCHCLRVIVMSVDERVVPALAGVRWDPGAPDAVLVVTDSGLAALALRPYPGDGDPDCVVFVWSGVRELAMGAPNDEARPGHRLYKRGLESLIWAGLVEHSERTVGLEHVNRVHLQHDAERFSQLRHYVLPLKEDTAEVIAETIEVQRHPGPTFHAASLALRSSRPK